MAEKLSQEELNKIAAGDFGHYVEGLKPIEAAKAADPADKMDLEREKAQKKEKRPVGRPKVMKDARILSFQVSYEEYEMIRIIMAQYDIKQSDAIRKLLITGAYYIQEKHLDMILDELKEGSAEDLFRILKQNSLCA